VEEGWKGAQDGWMMGERLWSWRNAKPGVRDQLGPKCFAYLKTFHLKVN
jgi:hypothetical protein